MKLGKSFVLTVFSALVLAGCSGGSDDDGGTVGGSGLIERCQQAAGVYKYADGSRMEIKPNCEFIITKSDGNYGHGKVNSVSEDGAQISLDMIIDSGPDKGWCATLISTPNSLKVTNEHKCT